MVEVLQRFSPGNLGLILGIVLATWLVWPILCGLIGSKRGVGLQGVTHGFLWGPLGLVFVLLSRTKHECPTCGKRTLLEKYNPSARQPLPTAPSAPTPPPIVKPSIKEAEPAFHEVCAAELEEQQQLRAWINK